jgi:hypothetical protein
VACETKSDYMITPKELKRLNDDLAFAYYDLEEYSIIFLESETRINLLNKVAPSFFVTTKNFYWNSFIMTISRFTDPCEQSSNKNLSLDSLQKYITEIDDRGQDLFNSNLKKIGLEVKDIRKMRSKYISHRDYDYALLDKKDIEAIEINKIREIYELLGQCLNIFNKHCLDRIILFKGLRTNHGARSLIYYLKEGVIYSEVKTRRKNLILNMEETSLSQFKDA